MMAARSRRVPDHGFSPRGPLLGMYALLAAALACVGASAGNLFFVSDRSLLVSFASAVNRCALRYPVTGYLSAHLQEYNHCRQAAYRTEGWIVVAAAAAVPLVTAGLVFVVPWLDRWRLARAGRSAEIQGATARFRLLCDQAGLAGRRRPGLQVAGLALRQAFTTALPGGRPLVVIPVKTALSYRDPQRFDPVVLHELAHVRSRDVSRVSTVRGLAAVTVPALALASAPGVLSGGSLQAQRTFLLQAGAFVASALLLAVAVLRRREFDADRQAVRWLGSPAALRQALEPADRLTRPRELARWRPALLAAHPSLGARITALRDPLGARDSGFAYALAVGAITAMVMNVSYFIAWAFDVSLASQLPTRVSAGAGGLMLGLGLTPALIRRAARARDAGISARWWLPAAGIALGLFLGSLIPPGTALGATITVFAGQGLAGIVTAGILACLGAGVVALTAGLASLATATPAGRVPAWIMSSITVVMSCCAAAALLPIPGLSFSEPERLYLVFVLPDDQWRWLAILYPAAAVALAVRICPRRRLIHAAAAALGIPVLAATVTAVLFFPHAHAIAGSSPVALQHLGEEQWWVATFAGLAVLIILSLGRGVPGLARACVSAWLTTLLAGVERAIYGAFTGGLPPNFGRLPSLLATPSVWLFYLAVPASCLALICVRPPAALRRRWTMPAAACAGTAATAVAVVITGIPGLFVPLASASSLQLPGSLHHADPLTEPPIPSGVLTNAAARAIITRVGEALPDNWASDTSPAASPPAGHTTITPATCRPFLDGDYLTMLPHPLTRTQGQYKILPGFIDGAETLRVAVDSYARPVPAALFAAMDRDVRACHRYVLTDPAGPLTASVREVAVHGLSVPARRAEVSISSGTASSAMTWVEIGIGHNLVMLSQATSFTGSLAQPDEAVIDAAEHAITSANPPQILTQAAAGHIAGAVGPHLGPEWVPSSPPAAAPALVTYQPANCAALAHEYYLGALARPLTQAEDRYEADGGLETLSVRIESFAQPVPGSLLTAASQIFRSCPRYTVQTSGSTVAGSNGPSFVTTHAVSEPGLGFPAWRGDISTDLDPGSAATTWIMITAGRNFILISQNTISAGSGSQPDEKVITAAVTATISALAYST